MFSMDGPTPLSDPSQKIEQDNVSNALTNQPSMQPHFGDVQAHYDLSDDLSDDFFRLFLDATQTFSRAYFVREDMTLQEAQTAKIDLALSKVNLRAGTSTSASSRW